MSFNDLDNRDIPIDKEIVSISIDEVNEAVKNINIQLPILEDKGFDEKLINEIFRYFHSIKGLAGLLNLSTMKDLCQKIEDILGKIRAGKISINSESLDLIYHGIDIIKNIIDSFKNKKNIDDHADDIHDLTNKLVHLNNPSKKVKITKEAKAAKITKAAKKTVKKSPVKKIPKKEADFLEKPKILEDTFRIKTKKLDYIMNRANEISVNSIQLLGNFNEIKILAGEIKKLKHDVKKLITDNDSKPAKIKNILNNIHSNMLEYIGNLDKVIEGVTISSSQLSDGIIKARMVSIDEIFSQFPKLVRDISRKYNKKIKFDIKSNNLEIDKQLVELIYMPLVHILRNAVDHGIETKAKRIKKGKHEKGHLELTSEKDEFFLYVIVKDDGGGIDPEVIKKIALKKKLITKEKLEKLPSAMVYDLICLPGFSTKTKVTEISGRGVGMDVVKDNVEKINGTLEISSEINKGTVFKMIIPTNIALIRGFLYEEQPDD